MNAVAARRLHYLLIPGSACLLAGCSSGVDAQKMGEIKPAMSTTQVEALLGQPSHIDHAETTGLRGDVYDYVSIRGEGRVVFLNDVVFKAEFLPASKRT
jgi:outer membrane protein assembly factor BamE (lipoprotein component of BamABCDE complex)